jgi:hypothetical protein
VVADSPWSARSAANGQARIDNIPPGAYRLRIWHAGLPLTPEPAAVALTIGSADLAHATKLAVMAEPPSPAP